MSTKNLWGNLTAEESVRTPTNVLKEQAAALTEMTNGILRGRVWVSSKGEAFNIGLSIVAPAITNYVFEVVDVEHDIDIYPLTVIAAGERDEPKEFIKCQDEEEFMAALGRILGSERIRRVISSLIAQSKAM